MEGPKFLKQKYNNIQNTEEVEKAKKRTEIREGVKMSQKPEDKIQNYLDRFKEITEREDKEELTDEENEKLKNRGIRALKKVLMDKYVMTEETIPESYFAREARIHREMGRGDVDITEEWKKEKSEVVIDGQKESLESWLDYLASPEAGYPDWFTYFAFRSMLSLGTWDKENKRFTKRTKETTAPYPPLDREALALVWDGLEAKYKGDDIEDEDFQKLLQSENFGKLYAYALEQKQTKYNPEIITGKWVQYEQGSDPTALQDTLDHDTGWCIHIEAEASLYLQSGSVRVYYSNDHFGQAAIPRLAIVEKNNRITEIRGVAPDENIDPYIYPILNEELNRLGPKGETYQKASADMKQLTAIERKNQQSENLTAEEIKFLYEIDNDIIGFGDQKDPRIEEIQETRNIKEDLAPVFNCREDQISLTEEEALSGDIVYHYGDLDLSDFTSAEGLTTLPEIVAGNLNLRGLTSPEGLDLSKTTIGGDLSLKGLTSAKGLDLSNTTIGQDLSLGGLTSPEGLDLSKTTIGRNLYLNGLTSPEGLDLSKTTIGRNLYLNGLTSPEVLDLSKMTIGGSLYLWDLTSPEELDLSKMTIGGDLDLNRLTSAKGLDLSNTTIAGDLDLRGLTSPEGLDLSNTTIAGDLDLRGLTSAERDKLREQYPNLNIVPD